MKARLVAVRSIRWVLPAGMAALVALAALSTHAARLAQTGAVVLRADPAALTVAAGQEFEVSLVIDAGSQPVDTVDAFLSFDPGLLQVVQLTPGVALPTVLASSFDNASGRITYSAGKQLGGPDPTGTFAVVTVHLQALSTPAPGGTPLAYLFEPPSRITDVFYQGQSVFGEAQNGSVTILIAPSPTPTSTPTDTPTPTGTSTPTPSPTDMPTPTATPTPEPPTAVRAVTLKAAEPVRESAPAWPVLAGVAAVVAVVWIRKRLANHRNVGMKGLSGESQDRQAS